jgi:hypothetical protein
VRFHGPPQAPDTVEDLKTLLIVHQLVVEAVYRFLEDAADSPRSCAVDR